MLKLSDFDYELPQELIAQRPALRRSGSRLMVVRRSDNSIQHKRFCDIISYLKKGDLLVVNDTKVLPARVLGRRQSGGRVEILLLHRRPDLETNGHRWRYQALIKPLGRLKDAEEIILDRGIRCRLVSGRDKIVSFDQDPDDIMRRIGEIPLPPYIRRPADASDRRRYQTIFARREGAVAAPTAGLHFTRALLARLKEKKVGWASVTLHVGPGTFVPVREEEVSRHRAAPEYFLISPAAAGAIRRAKERGGRIVAVGTTVCKALEDSATQILGGDPVRRPIAKWSDLFIYPSFTFRVIDALVTNFHLPRTSLLMLVSAFAGADLIREAYRRAVNERYRFYSYGDAMVIL